MTEKRYKAIPETGSYKDIVTGEYLSPKFEKDYYKVLDLLNENEQLKKHIQELQNHLKRLENENIHNYTLIKEAYETERTAIGKNVLKQLMEQIQ